MGLALHCHGELKLKNGRDGRERDTRRKMELFPRALALLQALQMCSSCLQNAKRCGSLRENRRKRGHLTHQRKRAPGGRVSPPGASHQTGGKSSRYRLAVTKCRQAVTNSSACLALGWRMAGGLFRLALASRRQALPADIFLLSLLFRVTH